MKLLIESAMIFFGTLMAAGVVALGEPPARPGSTADIWGVDVGSAVVAPLLELTRPHAR